MRTERMQLEAAEACLRKIGEVLEGGCCGMWTKPVPPGETIQPITCLEAGAKDDAQCRICAALVAYRTYVFAMRYTS